MIKLVNYIRNEVRWGNKTPDLSSKSLFDDDQYLQPILEDDALLYSLDDINECIETRELPTRNGNSKISSSEDDGAGTVGRVVELEKTLHRLQQEYRNYRETVDKTLNHRWHSTEDASFSANRAAKSINGTPLLQDNDSYYFSSYSTNGRFF